MTGSTSNQFLTNNDISSPITSIFETTSGHMDTSLCMYKEDSLRLVIKLMQNVVKRN